MTSRDFPMVSEMNFMDASRLTQRLNVAKNSLVKVVTSAIALPVIESHALGNVQLCLIANFDVH
jgi:hypothetical protein